jgi:hypothetical protein
MAMLACELDEGEQFRPIMILQYTFRILRFWKNDPMESRGVLISPLSFPWLSVSLCTHSVQFLMVVDFLRRAKITANDGLPMPLSR